MTFEELCELRDKIIMDDTYSAEEQIVLVEALNPQIYGY
jgi:hypothetical protein